MHRRAFNGMKAISEHKQIKEKEKQARKEKYD